MCKGRNVLLKYKDGVGLQPQTGETRLSLSRGTKQKSVGGNIDMKTNVRVIELVV